MPASPAPTGGLRWLQHFTAWSLAFLAAVVACLALTSVFPPGAPALPPWARAATVTAALVACTAAAWLFLRAVYRPGPAGGAGPRPPWWLLAAAAVAALGACVGLQAAGAQLWPWVTLPAVVTSAVLASTPWPRLPTAAIGTALTGVGSGAAGADWWTGATAAAATGLCIGAIMTQIWVWEIAVRTDRARRDEAEAAVDAERQRFAAELHDIQGHSLQVIVLKSELAARLADVDPARAAAEMREVEALARAALRDTRDVVQGYREVSLETEIGNAVRVLAAAGVRCRTAPGAAGAVPPGQERLFALVVREATTNVIRHSTATDAEIALESTPDGMRLTVTNDAPLTAGGPAGGPAGGSAGGSAGGPAGGSGSSGGLDGLARRLAAVGGRLDRHAGPGRFQVVATLPRPAQGSP